MAENRQRRKTASWFFSGLIVSLMLVTSLPVCFSAEPETTKDSLTGRQRVQKILPGPCCADVTIYYRPPLRQLDVWDWGHVILYVRNDETGEAAYFDYYPEQEYSVLGAVDQARLDAHASLTIIASAAQERKILDGVKEMQQRLPDWKLRVLAVLFLGKSSTCVSRSLELLRRGGINLKGRDPRDVWEAAWRNYSNEYLTWQEEQKMTNGKIGKRYRPGPDMTHPQMRTEYGRDPQGQARRVDPKAINNQMMYFKNGQRVK